MAGFRTHITVSTAIGLGYGAASANPLHFGPEAGVLAAGLTAVGGMLPDLDSDSGIPVREVSGLAAAVVPILLLPRLVAAGQSQEGRMATLVILYILIRYGLAYIVRHASVHRGMWHSIPTMLIFGCLVYIEYTSPNWKLRLYLAGGVMLGFLSHLVLDELYSVDFNGVRLRLNKSAGSAVKCFGPSWVANSVCYGILLGLLALVYLDSVQYLD